MCVPEADTSSQQDGLVGGELCDDLVDVGVGKV